MPVIAYAILPNNVHVCITNTYATDVCCTGHLRRAVTDLPVYDSGLWDLGILVKGNFVYHAKEGAPQLLRARFYLDPVSNEHFALLSPIKKSLTAIEVYGHGCKVEIVFINYYGN